MKKKATTIIEDLENSNNKNEPTSELIERLEAANQKSFGIIEAFFDTGYIDFLAKLLVYLPEARRSEALAKLPEAVGQKVKESFDTRSEKSNLDPEVLSAAGTVLKQSGFYAKACSDEVIGNLLDFRDLKSALEPLYKINPILAMNVDYYHNDLSIILCLDDRAIQKWLRDADQQDLAIGLQGVDEEILDKVFRNMSRRAATMLKEDMEFMGPVRLSHIFEKQRQLLCILDKLEASGDIIICREDLPDIGEGFIN